MIITDFQGKPEAILSTFNSEIIEEQHNSGDTKQWFRLNILTWEQKPERRRPRNQKQWRKKAKVKLKRRKLELNQIGETREKSLNLQSDQVLEKVYSEGDPESQTLERRLS